MEEQPTVPLHTGSTMPAIGLGTWQLTDDTAGTVAYALELGYRMIDTSSDYGTHEGIGEAVKRSSINRDKLYIVTKVEENDDAYTATKKYLQELGLAYADLMLIHRPPPTGTGESLWRGLIKAKEDGLAKDIGVSNYSTSQIQALIDATDEMPAVNQIEWTPFGYGDTMLDYCQDHGIVIQAYSPLTRTKRLDNETLRSVAANYGKTPAQVLIRWNLQLGTPPLPKANDREHLKENIDVFDFAISDNDMETLNGLNENYSALGSSPLYL